MKMKNITNCPFCGSDNLCNLCEFDKHMVRCLKCNTRGPMCANREKAQKSWNEREYKPDDDFSNDLGPILEAHAKNQTDECPFPVKAHAGHKIEVPCLSCDFFSSTHLEPNIINSRVCTQNEVNFEYPWLYVDQDGLCDHFVLACGEKRDLNRKEYEHEIRLCANLESKLNG